MRTSVTAVEGGHIESLGDSNAIIREIVQARNASKTTSRAEPSENPKDAPGRAKVPLDLLPAPALAEVALAIYNGSLKYGKWNWRKIPIRASVYVAAALRHLAAWQEGEDHDHEGPSHLAAAAASILILMDAARLGMLDDDRPPSGGYRDHAESLSEMVGSLANRHATKCPVNYTISGESRDSA